MDKKLVAIRGAITAKNDKRSIVAASVRLFDRLLLKNGISDCDIVSVTASTTADITAFYPVRAIREAGHPLCFFSCLEPNIDGGLKGCIRLMIYAYSDRPVYNAYLNGAKQLRADIAGVYSIALDGPSGAGKSTVAKIVAKELDITYLDTGALYRALGVKALDAKVDTKDAKAVKACLADAKVGLEYENGVQRVTVDGVDVTGRIRTPEVSMAASNVSAVPFIREKLLDLQRDIAKKQSVILDGRDIGTVVLPQADYKFFLTASAEIRAKRRFDELIEKGQTVTFESVLNDVNSRDKNDSTRAIAPLKRAFDAEEINSDGITAREVADIVIGKVAEDLAK